MENAIDSGALIVEYDHNAEVSEEPQVTTKTFAISSVEDRKEHKWYTFDEAVDHGILDRESGMFTDTQTGKTVNLVEAMQRHYVKGKVVTDNKKIEAFMNRNRSASMDSQSSESDTSHG